MVKPPDKSHRIDLPADLDAIYANVVRVSHSPAELIMDFARLLPGQSPAKVLSRIIMSPMGAKLFHRILGENLARYEASYGEIQLPRNTGLAQQLFRTVNPPNGPPDTSDSPENPPHDKRPEDEAPEKEE